MNTAITIPPAEEIRQRIDVRRREIAELKRVLRLAQAATAAAQLADESNSENERRQVMHA